jgi:hypothetical protein
MNKNILKIEYDLDTKNTIIYLRDEAIGLIQDFEFRASVENPIPQIEFTFPDLKEWHGKLFQNLQYHEENLLAAKQLGNNIKIKFLIPGHCAGPIKQEIISKEFSSSIPIEEIDLSKFDQPKSESSDIPA